MNQASAFSRPVIHLLLAALAAIAVAVLLLVGFSGLGASMASNGWQSHPVASNGWQKTTSTVNSNGWQ